MADKSQERVMGYIVITTTLEGKDYQNCKIIPEGDIYPAIYRQVFGPASEKDCKQWAAKNCKKSSK